MAFIFEPGSVPKISGVTGAAENWGLPGLGENEDCL